MTHSTKLKHRVSLLEALAELEHKQWESWSKYVMSELLQGNPYDLINLQKRVLSLNEKWFANWKPYEDLTEELKEADRKWARKALRLLLPSPRAWVSEVKIYEGDFMKPIKAYKFVGKDLTNQGFRWEVGKWFKLGNDEPLELCKNGFHASKEPIDALEYTSNGERLFMVEARGIILKDTDKFCSSEMRLVKEIPLSVLQWFAIACAKHVLKNYTKEYPKDKRPAEAIQAAEDYLNNPTKENLEKLNLAESAWSAAESAAWFAWSAAESAAWFAWSAAESAWFAAWSAAESAAWFAWSAAESARSAAWSAAESAWFAAWSAAESAERKWQNKTLKHLIKEAIE